MSNVSEKKIVEPEVSAEDIYRKYVESALKIIQEKLISPETNMVHVSGLSEGYGVGYSESVPLEENILYILLLLRTKTQESINVAKERLFHLLRYQNSDGSFPVTVTEFGSTTDWTPSFRILLALFQIHDGFQHILGSDLVEKIERSFSLLFLWCREIIQKTKGNSSSHFVMHLLFSWVGMVKYPAESQENYREHYSQIVQSILDTDELLDMSQSGILITLLLSYASCIHQDDSKAFLDQIQSLAAMWNKNVGYNGPAFSNLFSGYSKAISSGDVAMSLLEKVSLTSKPDTWPRSTLFSIALLYPCVHLPCDAIRQYNIENSVSKISTDRWGYSAFLKSHSALSWIFGSRKTHKKKGFFPLRAVTPHYDCVATLPGYCLHKCHIETNAQSGKTFHFTFLREEGEESEGQNSTLRGEDTAIVSFYMERKSEKNAFFHQDGSQATYFNAHDTVNIGRNNDSVSDSDSSVFSVSIQVDSQDVMREEEQKLYAFRVRAGDRPGQLKAILPHILRQRKMNYHEGHDWVLEFGHSRGKKPAQIDIYFSHP